MQSIKPFSENLSLANFNHDHIVATWLQYCQWKFFMPYLGPTPAGEQRPKLFQSLHGFYAKPLSSRRRAVAKLFRAKTGLLHWFVIRQHNLVISYYFRLLQYKKSS
jgi:hypothetical protein